MLKNVLIAVFLFVPLFSMAAAPEFYSHEVTAKLGHGSPYEDSIDGYPIVIGDKGEKYIVLERNEADRIVTMPWRDYMRGREFLSHVVDFFFHRHNFTSVTSYLTPEMEEAFDVFVLVNVAPGTNGEDMEGDRIPPQHMRILRKRHEGQTVFRREDGQIVGLNPDVLGMGDENNPAEPAYECLKGQYKENGKVFFSKTQGLMKDSGLFGITSGNGPANGNSRSQFSALDTKASDTPTGIYRVGMAHTQNSGKGKSKSGRRTMFYPMYFDLIYPNGWKSNLALHGTFTSLYDRLGVRQDSLGCIRTHQQVSWCLKKQFFNIEYDKYHGGKVRTEAFEPHLPNLDWRYRLKSHSIDPLIREVETKGGVPVLFVIFYNYEGDFRGSSDKSFSL